MATPLFLTRTEGYALTDSGKAARTDCDHMTTRTAMYAWNEQTEQWECTHSGLRVVHAKGQDRGFIWRPTLKRFVRCACEQCNR